MMGTVSYLSDRRLWPTMQTAWQSGLASRCPDGHDPEEWRASARRLARVLGCTVRTGIQEREGHPVAVAVANGGYPLGIIDADDRYSYDRRQADAGD